MTSKGNNTTQINYVVIALLIVSILSNILTYNSIRPLSSSVKEYSENVEASFQDLTESSNVLADISVSLDEILEILSITPEEPSDGDTEPQEEVTLVVGSTLETGGPITPLWTHGANEIITEQMFEGLVQYVPGTTELEPVLASNLGETEDSIKWTFYLRRGIKFHDGTTFDAHAVKAHFDNSFETMAGLTYMFTDALLNDSRTTNSVVVVDDYTIEFNLNFAANIWPAILANFASYIESPTSISTYGLDGINDHPVGTGPFKYVSQKLGEEVVLEADQEWWRLKDTARDGKISQNSIKINNLIFKQLSDPSTLRFAIETGEIDVAWEKLNTVDYPDLLENPELVAHDTGAVSKLRLLVFQGEESIYSTFIHRELREAFAYAIDYDMVINAVFGGLADRIYSIMPIEYQEYKATAKYHYDPETAKELIAEAGFETPVKVTLWWTPTHYGTTERDIVTIIKSSAAEAGFDVDISNSPDYATYKGQRKSDVMEMSLWGWSADYPDQDSFTTPFMYSKGWTSSNFKTHSTDFSEMIDIVDPLIEEALSTPDPVKKKELVFEVQDHWAEWLPEIFLWRAKSYSFTRNDVSGVIFGPVGSFDVDFYGASK